MELYTLDSTLRRAAVVDMFESLIWTERFSEYGDFELVVHSTNESRNLLAIGTRLAMNESYRVMTVETVENKMDSEGRTMLKVTGRSLESILLERVNRSTNVLTGGVVVDKIVMTDAPAEIARWMFDAICRNNVVIPADNIPFIAPGNLFPIDTIPEPMEDVTIEIPISTVYDVIKDICVVYDLGFRLYRGLDDSKLYFNIYSGSDRTALQLDLPAVVFAPDLDNLADVTELTSIEQYSNVAYVMHTLTTLVVYELGGDTAEGFQRRVIYVDATDIDLPLGPELTAALNDKGKAELAKRFSLAAFDGEVPQFGSYKYGVDYQLGDLVEMRNDDGVTNQMRVTEQIFVSDSEGERSYPTLSTKLFITPGSWFAWDYNQVWDDADGYWADA